MVLAETSGGQRKKYKIHLSIFVISGESWLPFWGKVSNIQTCPSLFIVATGIFLLQAESSGSFSEFPSMSFIHFFINQHDSLDFLLSACLLKSMIFFLFELDRRDFKE